MATRTEKEASTHGDKHRRSGHRTNGEGTNPRTGEAEEGEPRLASWTDPGAFGEYGTFHPKRHCFKIVDATPEDPGNYLGRVYRGRNLARWVLKEYKRLKGRGYDERVAADMLRWARRRDDHLCQQEQKVEGTTRPIGGGYLSALRWMKEKGYVRFGKVKQRLFPERSIYREEKPMRRIPRSEQEEAAALIREKIGRGEESLCEESLFEGSLFEGMMEHPQFYPAILWENQEWGLIRHKSTAGTLDAFNLTTGERAELPAEARLFGSGKWAHTGEDLPPRIRESIDTHEGTQGRRRIQPEGVWVNLSFLFFDGAPLESVRTTGTGTPIRRGAQHGIRPERIWDLGKALKEKGFIHEIPRQREPDL
jgi:hypothetical protein